MATLSAADQERVYYHLGYMNVQPAASLQLGIPRPIQTVFLVQQAITNLIQATVPRILSILSTMDLIEQKMVQALDRLAALQIEEVKLNEMEGERLEREYCRWGKRLADNLGVPIYPYSDRFSKYNRRSMSIPVRNV